VVEVFRDMLVVAVLPHYQKYKKYNLQQLSGQQPDELEVSEKPTRVLTIAEIIKRRQNPDQFKHEKAN